MKKLFTLIFICFGLISAQAQNNCQAYFYAQVGMGNDTVNFTDYSYNTDSTQIHVLTWHWSFGDNTSDTIQNPQHIYSGPGTYYVCLSITTANNCSGTYCDSVVVTSPSSGCTAFFNYYPDTSCTACYNFYNGSTGTGLSYFWSFGDGTTDTSQFPFHQFNYTGVFDVCLTISNGLGCMDTYCDSVYVNSNPPNCQAYFYDYPDTMAGSLTYYFTDYSTGSPYSWLWNFGDGDTSVIQNPVHTYSSAGTYTVCLTITTQNCVDTFCTVVVVSGQSLGCQLFVSYSVVPESYPGSDNGSVTLTVNNGNPPFTYYWTNGATTQNISNISSGYYDVSVTDSSGCSTFASVYVADSSITNIPVGTLSNLPQDTCLSFNYDTVYVYNVDVIDSFHVAVTWIFLETLTGTNAYLIDTFAISNQGYYTVSITITCSQKSSHIYYGHIYVDYHDISLFTAGLQLPGTFLELFPNPFSDEINLKFQSASGNPVKLKLSDISGKIIFERNYNALKGLNNYSINTEKLSHGVYLINMIFDNKVYNRKIIK